MNPCFDLTGRTALVTGASRGLSRHFAATLARTGVDDLDPIQPDAMDLKALAREYGGKVALSGRIGDQRLARWTPAQVKDEIRRTMDLLEKAFDNTYLVAPSNMLTPEIPLANLVSMFETCHEY